MTVDVLLVNAFCLAHDPVEQRLMEPYFPLGMLYIAGALREAGYSVAIYDNCFAPDIKGCQDAITQMRPRVVGLNALNTTRRLAVRIGRWARAEGYTVMIGGPEATVRPAAYVEDQEGGAPADIAVIGEGEATVVELVAHLTGKAPTGGPDLRALPLAPAVRVATAASRAGSIALREAPAANDPALDAIAGVAYRGADGAAVITAQRPAIANLDALPFPAWDLIDRDRYRRAWVSKRGFYSMSLITSRGCPFGCNWCAKPVFGRAYRLRSPQNVVAEMVWLKENFAPDAVRIVDDIFGLNRRWLDKWHAEVIAQNAALPFECLSRTDLVKAGTLTKLKEAGCRKIFFGAESGSQTVLDAMNKGISVEDTTLAARAMREVGLAMHFYVMIGYPGEEQADIQTRTGRTVQRTVCCSGATNTALCSTAGPNGC
ncbi:MAG: radical SAM protein [Chloroflexi bacterium]|nr:radical SAM protein [Chloroflexota bacterium]